MKKIEKEVIYNNKKMLAVYANECLEFDKREFNEPLSSLIEDWLFSNIDETFDTLLATFICKNEKDKNCDLDNLLFYNLNHKEPLNYLIAKIKKRIIFQCIEKANPKYLKEFNYIYFYGLFNENNEELDKCLLCNFNKFFYTDQIPIVKNKFIDLLCAPKDKNLRNSLLDELYMSCSAIYEKYNKIPERKKYALKIFISDDLSRYICTIDNLKHFIDCIIIYLNKLNIINHHVPERLLYDDGRYNPTDNFLFFCEIEKINLIDSNTFVYLCLINDENNKEKCCCNQKESLKNLMKFIVKLKLMSHCKTDLIEA